MSNFGDNLNLSHLGYSIEDALMNSTEGLILEPINQISNKIDESKLGEISSVKRKTGVAKSLVNSTKTLFKVRRVKRERRS